MNALWRITILVQFAAMPVVLGTFPKARLENAFGWVASLGCQPIELGQPVDWSSHLYF
ncbi:hypothetical protein [Pacificibacter maritimus]|uniref:hypothetical protein n=1 Tax=Pacificibacter maritimus TaxID=762213 RepID=UPI001472A821|nr:hypothetical protein [Pacificibacter maritimus]